MNYKFLVQYDGTRYEGWQKQQRTEETIQGKLEKAFRKVTGEDVQVIGAGRTDAGVHSVGQTANVRLKKSRDTEKLEAEINECLPDDIYVKKLEEAGEYFHSRFDAVKKIYRYRVRTGSEKNVFERRFVWQYGKRLDMKEMERAAGFFLGEHDFTSFCGNKKMKKSAVRTVFSIVIKENAGEMQIDFTGDGFLQGMVRIMTGTLIEVGEGKRKAGEIPEIMQAADRERAGFTAPPQGLVLLKTEYE